MMTVADLLIGKKSKELCVISPDATVFEAIQAFAKERLGALLVVEDGLLVGLVTERDYARKVILQGRSSKTTKVRDIMSENLLYVTPESEIEECMALMINKYIRHLPVLDGEKLVGIVSIGDVVKAALGEREFMIEELVRYVTDSPMIAQEHRRRRESVWSVS